MQCFVVHENCWCIREGRLLKEAFLFESDSWECFWIGKWFFFFGLIFLLFLVAVGGAVFFSRLALIVVFAILFLLCVYNKLQYLMQLRFFFLPCSGKRIWILTNFFLSNWPQMWTIFFMEVMLAYIEFLGNYYPCTLSVCMNVPYSTYTINECYSFGAKYN